MKIRQMSVLTIVFVIFVSISVFAAKPVVLFDEGHAQRAGNADWVINGAFSDFADAFKSEGFQVKAVKSFSPSILKGVKVVVLPEPNSVYSKKEQDALVDFVNNGGCLYAISDHNHSDRNGDGIDSVGVLNQFVPRLGLKFEIRYFTEAPVTGKYLNDEITKGVKKVGTWGGTAISCIAKSAIAHIRVSSKHGGGAYIATNIVGTKGGKVIAMGDTSPYDDGTGDPHDRLYDGYNNPKYSHERLAHNTIKWILKKVKKSKTKVLRSIMKNMEAAQAKLQSSPDEATYMFIENSEKNLNALMKNNRALSSEFKKLSADKQVFERVNDSFKTISKFKELYNE